MIESELLPDSTRLTMVLEAASDIRHAERTLRDIELLNQQGVSGAGGLESMSTRRRELAEADYRPVTVQRRINQGTGRNAISLQRAERVKEGSWRPAEKV
jgi:hypothetical protein